MIIVLHTPDMEPITVISMYPEHYTTLLERGTFFLQHPDGGGCRILRIPLDSEDPTISVFVTPDYEQALKMCNTWLPAQRKEVNNAKRIIRKLSNEIRDLKDGV